jgi:hypothetical protein
LPTTGEMPEKAAKVAKKYMAHDLLNLIEQANFLWNSTP